MAFIYLLHFDEPISHARHYVGLTDNLYRRLNEHHTGNGAVLTREFAKHGIGFTVARVWKGATRVDERMLKNKKRTPDMCPVCSIYKQREPRFLKGCQIVHPDNLERSGIPIYWKQTKQEKD